MSTMAEVIGQHCPVYVYTTEGNTWTWQCSDRNCTYSEGMRGFTELVTHVADALTKAGYGKLADAEARGYRQGRRDGLEENAGACRSVS